MGTQKIRGTVLLPKAESYGGLIGRVDMPGLADLRGKRVAFIDDGRPNAGVLLAEYEALLVKKYGIRSVVIRKVDLGVRVNQPLPKDIFEKLANEVDAGVVALGS